MREPNGQLTGNESICSTCNIVTVDGIETMWDEDANPYCKSCFSQRQGRTEVLGAKALRTPPTSDDVGIRAGDIL